jgi:hypothetical protein
MLYSTSVYRRLYRFYASGSVNVFAVGDAGNFQPQEIDPEISGSRGVVYKDNEKVVVDLFTITGYAPSATYGIDKYEIRVDGDLLLVKQLKNPGSVTVYKRRELTDSYLQYKPSW